MAGTESACWSHRGLISKAILLSSSPVSLADGRLLASLIKDRFSERFPHLVCRIPHTLSRSTVGSAPRRDKGYRCLHTSGRSAGKQRGSQVGCRGQVCGGGAEQVQMHSTCRIKCLCEGSCRSRSWWSRCSLKVNKNSFCLLMSVARMREPSCCSMSCLQDRGAAVGLKADSEQFYFELYYLVFN